MAFQSGRLPFALNQVMFRKSSYSIGHCCQVCEPYPLGTFWLRSESKLFVIKSLAGVVVDVGEIRVCTRRMPLLVVVDTSSTTEIMPSEFPPNIEAAIISLLAGIGISSVMAAASLAASKSLSLLVYRISSSLQTSCFSGQHLKLLGGVPYSPCQFSPFNSSNTRKEISISRIWLLFQRFQQ